MQRLKTALNVVVLALVLGVTALNHYTMTSNVNQLVEARISASLAVQNTMMTHSAQQYAAQRDHHALVFANAAAREQYIAQVTTQQYENAFARARVYVELCHAKLDAAKVAYPTQDELDGELERRAVEQILQKMLEEKTTNPEPTPAEPTDGEPTPAPEPK